jgi:threonine dehydratase
MISISDIQGARRSIAGFVHRTPLIHSHSLSVLSGADVYLKLENLQKTGSFKVRGAINKMARVSGSKVITASMGNHAQAVAFAARMLGKKAKIVMPVTAPLAKEEATRGYQAEVLLHGENFKEALLHARTFEDHLFIHGFDDDEVIAGQGTIALELLEELTSIDFVVVPVGGGGLIAGIAVAIKALSPGTALIGVQAQAAPSACLSFREKQLIERTPGPTIADGIAINKPGDRSYEIIESKVDDMVQVNEDSIARAILLLLERKKLVAEGAGAVGLAALLEDSGRFRGKRVVLIISGGNVDFTVVDRIIHKGLAASGRIGVFALRLPDRPGSLSSVLGIMASRRANILDIVHDHLAADLPFNKTLVTLTVEIRGQRHRDEILDDLREQGLEVMG